MNAMLRSMLTMRPLPRSRVVFAARSGLCMGVPVLARGVDTAVGCAVALAVFQLTWPKASAKLIHEELVQTLSATAGVAADLAAGDVTGEAAHQRQRELQHRTFALSEAYDRATAASRQPRQSAERMWPVIAAAEELAFRVLTACWAIAMHAVGGGRTRPVPDGLPGFLEKETAGLGHALESVDA
ncbi:hypothetical protein ACOPJQ_13040 [Luteimonas dalianensis]|uniref:hypothetical protein n=1 Tax=Luteimonas dalianensis TaxID=1148196 RepID=UPI003BF14E6D